ncbi:uncharacterized protein C8Q71DRAFT_559596 [Rhodofomes roseus]|uniref:MATH domain-containing protein n=1 Tax=Rhodofomes roseus TaxID=34475 RepID=A0ABQ8KIG3_9APHY|nr:uncharacterized protein C8Q71DRAFT_559596 [Rhodofomes roseus]KAH9837753.1 hypothetical protein C8Q71DRAFT_559596 [Rhodofomes roseus]
MKVALSHLEHDHDIKLQFRIDDLEEFFDRGVAQPYVTDTFGPGWRIECWPTKSDGEECMSCFLDVGPAGYPRPILCSFVGESISSGHRYFEHTATYTFSPDRFSSRQSRIRPTSLLRTQHWYRFRRLRQENGLVITATIRAQATALAFSDACEGFGVLHDLITGRDPCDVKFVAFASRNTGGELVQPRVLSFNKKALWDKCPRLKRWSQNPNLVEIALAQVFSDQLLRCINVPLGDMTSFRLTNSDGDSDFEDENECEEAGVQRTTCQTPPVVVGLPAATWEAFLFYIYTGVIIFAPLTSNGTEARREFMLNYKANNPRRPKPCSCKSIYRIALKLDMADLKDLALKELKSQLSKDNIVKEIFTPFTSQYEEVKEMELQLLKRHWEELKGSAQVTEMLSNIVSGRYPHATSIMTEIWQSVGVVPT